VGLGNPEQPSLNGHTTPLLHGQHRGPPPLITLDSIFLPRLFLEAVLQQGLGDQYSIGWRCDVEARYRERRTAIFYPWLRMTQHSADSGEPLSRLAARSATSRVSLLVYP
jgi:hypothetical protein